MADEPLENVDDQTQNETDEASRQALIDRTQARLDEVAGIESVDEDVKPVVDEKPKDDLESTDEDEKPKDEDEKPKDDAEDEDEGDDGKDGAAEVGKEEPTEPTLPESYRRSLRAYDWTDEEITAGFEAAPDKFLQTAERIHRNRNAETAGYAQAGRQARVAAVQPDAGSVVPDRKLPGQMNPVDAAALAEKFGQEELVTAIVSPVNDVIERINVVLPQLEESRKAAESSRLEVLGQQIDTFFTAKEMKPYSKVYGDTTKTALTGEQQKNREKVLVEADAVIIGAKLQGRQLTVEEGLQMAHDYVASEFKEQVIRTDIKKKTKKRAKGITVPPSHRGKPPGDGKPTTRKQLETKVAAGLKSVFNS